MQKIELEARFLEIDKNDLISRLEKLGAKDEGENFLNEIIFYDKDFLWKESNEFVKLRSNGKNITLTYKKRVHEEIDGTEEIEVEVSGFEDTKKILEKSGLVVGRYQEKKRHTFVFNGVCVDIDTWPKVPTYVEIEGDSEEEIKKVSLELGFDWEKVVLKPPRKIIEGYLGFSLLDKKFFTFDKIE